MNKIFLCFAGILLMIPLLAFSSSADTKRQANNDMNGSAPTNERNSLNASAVADYFNFQSSTPAFPVETMAQDTTTTSNESQILFPDNGSNAEDNEQLRQTIESENASEHQSAFAGAEQYSLLDDKCWFLIFLAGVFVVYIIVHYIFIPRNKRITLFHGITREDL